MRLAAQAKGGFYPTPERVVDLLAELIHTPTGYYHRDRETLRILDPCCGAGEALAQLAERMDVPNAIPIETYGVELHRDRAEEAEKRLGHALASDLFATSVANGAFGLLLLNPPYDYDSEDKRTEHAFLTQTAPATWPRAGCWCSSSPGSASRSRPATLHPLRADAVLGLPRPGARGLRPGGVDGLPEGRPRSRRPRREHGAGVGGGRAGADAPRPHTLRSRRRPRRAATSCSPPAPSIPSRLLSEARRSGLWTSTEITDTLWPARDTRTRPLMPLRRGHMAMLVAAGFLDNLCLEAEGRRILVKGRTSEGDGHGGGQPRRRRSTGRSSRPPWSPWTWTTERSPTSPHKTAHPEPHHEAPPSHLPGTAGPRFVWTQRNTP